MNDNHASVLREIESGAPIFSEKTFYLEEFYGKSLLFALIPPAGQRISEFDSLVLTLRELRRNQTRCVVIVSPSALPKLMRRLGRLAPKEPPPVFNPSEGLRSRPYPPDSAVAEIAASRPSLPICPPDAPSISPAKSQPA